MISHDTTRAGRILRRSGFSMIDVMVSVVVLSTGLLAMAALQANLTRSATETRSRSHALTLANGVLDAIRAVSDRSVTNYQNLSTATWKSLVDTAEGNTSLTTPSSAVFGENFTVAVTVTRFVSDRDAADCGGAANTPCFRQAAVGDPADSDSAEYKRVVATLSWTDATNTPHSISVTDILPSLPSSNSGLLVGRPFSNDGEKRRPRVLINIPDEQGIIPIAVGTDEYGRDESTAATNPKPLRDQTTGAAGTSFTVLTYAAQGSNAEVQRKIETQIVTCKCTFGAPPAETAPASGFTSFFQTKLRPTYWTGSRYAVPESNTEAGITTVDSWGKTTASQSEHCNDCCRDHHDAATLGTDQPAYSPYRSAHSHYLIGSSTAVAAGDYDEACRLVRVSGIWRVAPDLRLEHAALLETKDTAQEFLPTDAATTNYTDFVINFLQARVIPTATGGTPAASLDDSLDVPEFIPMSTSDDTRFLHVRGLYLDYLMPATRSFLESQLANCAESPQINCLLPFLPFVSINSTEVGRYARSPDGTDEPSEITVTQGSVDLDASVPEGGVIEPIVGTAGDAEEVFALVSMARENTGLTDGGSVVNPLDIIDDGTHDNLPLGDSQEIQFVPCATCDTDGDGVSDPLDNCPLIANATQTNTDMDADDGGDACDLDDDNDGVADETDNCPYVANTLQQDTDFDAPGDDPDGDGVPGDGIGDACDVTSDNDGDGVLDGDDNCPYIANVRGASGQQPDSDGDGVGDACEAADNDGDGIPDAEDSCPLVANTGNDTDGDGTDDACDTQNSVMVNFTVTVDISGVDLASSSVKPIVEWNGSGQGNSCQPSSTASAANPNPYACSSALGPDLTLKFGKYNRISSVAVANSVKLNAYCSAAPNSAKLGSTKICYNYSLSSLSIAGTNVTPLSPTLTDSGKTGETSSVNVTIPTTGTPSVQAGFSVETQVDLRDLGLNVGYTCDAVSGAITFNDAYCD